jgi:hypothetical protein
VLRLQVRCQNFLGFFGRSTFFGQGNLSSWPLRPELGHSAFTVNPEAEGVEDQLLEALPVVDPP